MISSLEEIKSAISLATVPVKWNAVYPVCQILEAYKGKPIEPALRSFAESIFSAYPKLTVTSRSLSLIGTLAESAGLLLGYFVSSPEEIELCFVEGMSQKEWCQLFTCPIPRRKFFDRVKTWRLLKDEPSIFPVSKEYQLISPHLLPYYGAAKISRLGTDYLLVQYSHDVQKPLLKAVKVKTLEEVEVTVGEGTQFDPVEIIIEGHTFVGDSLSHLYCPDMEQREGHFIRIVEGGVLYTFDPATFIFTKEIGGVAEELKSIKLQAHPIHFNAVLIADTVYRGHRYILLSNACIMDLQGERIVNLRSIDAFKTLNNDVFSLSDKTSAYVMMDGCLMEQVPSPAFLRTALSRML